MDNFYGGRRGPKGDSVVGAKYNKKSGTMEFTIRKYVTSNEEGATDISITPEGDKLVYITETSFDKNNGNITFTYNNEEEEGKTKTVTHKLSIPSNRINDLQKATETESDNSGVPTLNKVNELIGKLESSGGTFEEGQTIDSWSEANGIIKITSKDIKIKSSQVGDREKVSESDESNIPTLNKVNALIDALSVESIGSDNQYIKTISEENGKISATTGDISDFATSEQGDKANSAIQGVSFATDPEQTDIEIDETTREVTIPQYPIALPASNVILKTEVEWEEMEDDQEENMIYVVYDELTGNASLHVGIKK